MAAPFSPNLFSAFVLLVRKADGWGDIRQALQNIQSLQQLQKQYEETYLENLQDSEQQTVAAVTLVAFYHLARLITLVGDYLRTGQPGYDAIITRLNVHYEHAVEALGVAQQPFLTHLADLLWAGCRELALNAIWTHVSRRLGKNVWAYVELLTATNREQPVIELWPSQQEAFQQHLLDPYQRSVLIEMPTSAGKTLLAKFMIAQTKTLYPEGLVAYIVPTRTLVNQVTLDLRADFRQLFRVEQAVLAFELDPLEERLLSDSRIDILVITPEKLDLLVRSDHPVTRNVSLVVADEAHNINDGERGARLECLLGTMKIEAISSTILGNFCKVVTMIRFPFSNASLSCCEFLSIFSTTPSVCSNCRTVRCNCRSSMRRSVMMMTESKMRWSRSPWSTESR